MAGIVGVLLLVCTLPSHGQLGFGNVNPTGVNAAFIKLFGPHTNFSAFVDARVLDKDGKDWVRVPLNISALDEKIVLDVDLTKAIARDMPPLATETLTQAGIDRVLSIVRPDKKATFLVYPNAQSYLNIPLSPEDSMALEKGYRVESTAAGKEILSGKERTKNNVVIRDSRGVSVLEATTWSAPELRNFPVKIETRQDKMTFILQFAKVQLTRPSATLFELPPDLTEYKDMQQMMFGIMKRIVASSMNGGGK
jgi:hypothetical protein